METGHRSTRAVNAASGNRALSSNHHCVLDRICVFTAFAACFVVSVVDQNDHSPTFSQEVYTATIVENSPRGQSLLRVVAVDPDVGLNAEVTYHLQDDPDGLLNIHSLLGIISSAAEFDFETSQLVTAKVREWD